jgi:RHS repeat-associated protein
MVATAPAAAPSSLAGPTAEGRSAPGSHLIAGRLLEYPPKTPFSSKLARRRSDQVVATCIGGARPHRGNTHRGRRRFSGQTRAGQYCRARYYHPTLQRFISEDPIGFAGGDINLYAYVWNSPTGLVDPLGLDAWSDAGNLAAGFGDTISLGGTAWIRGLWSEQFGLPDTVDQGSGWNLAGRKAAKVYDAVSIGLVRAAAAAPRVGRSVLTVLRNERGAIGFDANQDALIQIAKMARKLGGVTREEAAILREWAREYGVYFRGPEAHAGRGFGRFLHILRRPNQPHLGPVRVPTALGMKAYRIGLEPEGDVYAGLLEAALTISKSGLLVVRDTIELAPSGAAILAELNEFMLNKARSNRWPGTTLLDSEATVYRFAVRPESIDVLRRAANALYEWQQPDRPEDLAFLRDDDTPWLFSIAHEDEAFLVVTERELESTRARLPRLGPLIHEELDEP